MARIPSRGAADYARMFLGLLPRGAAWSRMLDSVLARLLAACAEEAARIDAAGLRLIEEADPQTALSGISDWERVLGLPDACLPSGTTLPERRMAVLAKLADTGRQDLAYWYELAAVLGYDVAIKFKAPFQCGKSQCGDPYAADAGLPPARRRTTAMLGPGRIRYWWEVVVYGLPLIQFECGVSAPPDALGKRITARNLECLMLRDKQAHTLLTFSYLEAET